MGKTLSTHEAQTEQWKHHFETILNYPEPTVLHDFKTDFSPALSLDVEFDEISINEIHAAIWNSKIIKQSDWTTLAEYLKGGGNIVAETLTTICITIWRCE